MDTYSQAGTYTAIAAIVVGIFAHYGYIFTQSEVLNVIVGMVALFGIIKQGMTTKNIAIKAGIHPSQQS